jgi:hypothetical protein
MIMIGAGAVGAVTIVTSRLARRRPAGELPARVGQPAESTPAGARATYAPVVLIPRSQWGARDPDVTPAGRGEHGPYSAANPNGWQVYDRPLADVLQTVIIHHSALPLSDGPVEIQQLHMEEKGFADVGYHYLIDAEGRLYEGRALNVRGAHTYAHNYGSVGVCLIGNFEEAQPTGTQLNTLHALLRALVEQLPNLRLLAGHKDFNTGATLCPGQNFHPMLAEIAAQHGLRYGVS